MSRIGAWTLLARNQQIGGKIGLFSDAEQAVPMVHDFSSALISTRGEKLKKMAPDGGSWAPTIWVSISSDRGEEPVSDEVSRNGLVLHTVHSSPGELVC